MQVAQGHVTDRPFARTIYTIAAKRFTGDLVLRSGGRPYRVSWEEGAAVAARSANPSDQAARVALTAGLIDSTVASDAIKVMGADPERDQVEILAEIARLSAEQAARLKRRLLAVRAARCFALADAQFSLDNARSMRADPEVAPIDARWLIYYGLRTHYSIERLRRELSAVTGRAFQLAEDALGSLAAFGFGAPEQALLTRLRRQPATVKELLSGLKGLDEHAILSVIYALVACDCLSVARAVSAAPEPIEHAETQPALAPQTRRGAAIPPPTRSERAAGGRAKAAGPTRAGNDRAAVAGLRPPTLRGIPGHPVQPRPRPRPRRSSAGGTGSTRMVKLPGLKNSKKVTAEEVEQVIREKLAQVEADADHFKILGLARDATDQAISIAYFQLAKRLHPDRLQALGLAERAAEAQRVFAEVNQAFAVLSNPSKRSEYRKSLREGGALGGASEADAEQLAARLFGAEEHFKKGEMALRRRHFGEAVSEFEKAVELNPDDAEHHALCAWATWCAAEDKTAAGKVVAKQLARALAMAANCVPAWYYRGMVAKEQGNVDLAIECFEKVIELKPKHHEAALELRVLRSRQSRDDGKKGLFRRKS